MCCNVLDGSMSSDARVGEGDRYMGKHGGCFDDEFMLYEFKISKCLLTQPHLWRDCPFVHPGEPVHRRHPSLYKGDLCPAVKQGQICPHGPGKCSHAHNAFEAWLHPEKYKTIMCRKGAKCTRDICFFAHSPGELRAPATPRPAAPSDASSEALAAASHWVTGGTSQFPQTATVPLMMTSAGSPGLSGSCSVSGVGPTATSMGPSVTLSGPSLMSAVPPHQLPAVSPFTLQASVLPVLQQQQQGILSSQSSATSAALAGGATASSGGILQRPCNTQQHSRDCNSPPVVSAAASIGSCNQGDSDSSDRAIRTALLRLQLRAALQGQPLPDIPAATSVEQAYGTAAAAHSVAEPICSLDADTYVQLLAMQQQQQTLHAHLQQQQQTCPLASTMCQQGLHLPSMVPTSTLSSSNCSSTNCSNSKALATSCTNIFAGVPAGGVQHLLAAPRMSTHTAVAAPVSAVSHMTYRHFDDSAAALAAVPGAVYPGGFAVSAGVEPINLQQVVDQQQLVAAYANTAIENAQTPVLGIDCKQLPPGTWLLAGLGV